MFTFLTPFKLYAAAGAIILLSAIVGIHLYHDRGIRIERDTAVSDLASYKSQLSVEVQKRTDEIAQTKKLGDDKVKSAFAERDAAMTRLGLEHIDRLKLSKQLGAINEKFNATQTRLTDTKLNYDTRLRLEATNSASRLSESAQSASGLPASDSDFATLRSACQITTVDLQTCYSYLEADTLACGREK